MTESGHEVKYHADDFQQIHDQSAPNCLVYNGFNHYLPSVIITPQNYNQHKLKEISFMSSSLLELTKDLKTDLLAPEVKTTIENLVTNLDSTTTALGPPDPVLTPLFLAKKPSKGRKGALKGPLWGFLPESASGLDTSSSPTLQNLPPPKPKKAKKVHKCHMCDTVKTRPSHLQAHIAKAHSNEQKYVCDDCGKSCSSTSNLNQHRRTKHLGIFKYNCTKCSFKTDSSQKFDTHKVTKHKSKVKKTFTCRHCKKRFRGGDLLRKHIKRGTCVLKKNFQCDTCFNWYKTKDFLDFHVKSEHLKTIPKHKCPKCPKVFGLKCNLKQHMAWHRMLSVLARAQKLTRAKKTQIQMTKRSKRAKVKQSAPAKLIASQSPKKSRKR